MHLFEVTLKHRYTPIALSDAVLRIGDKEEISEREWIWLTQLSTNKRLLRKLLCLATRYGYTSNFEPNHHFLDSAAKCASAYSLLSSIASQNQPNFHF
jgi:hypothetical protein